MEPLESAVLQAREEDADLIGLEFDHAEVHMLDLSDLEFRQVRFRACRFSHCRFSRASFQDCILDSKCDHLFLLLL